MFTNLEIVLICAVIIAAVTSFQKGYRGGARDGASVMLDGLVHEGHLVAFKNPTTGRS